MPKPYMIKTEDGYKFVPLGKEEWGDYDFVWPNFNAMIEALNSEGIKYKIYSVESHNG